MPFLCPLVTQKLQYCELEDPDFENISALLADNFHTKAENY